MKQRKEKQIFRIYDIRGIYPENLNEKTAERVGMATTSFLKQKYKKNSIKIALARDNRFSSPALLSALKKGALSAGASVIDFGLTATPMLYFAVWSRGFDGGIMITASHNPPNFNGFKIVDRNADMINAKNGLKKMIFSAENRLSETTQKRIIKKSGTGKEKKDSIIEDYINFNLKDKDLSLLKGLKVVIDTGNSSPGVLIKPLAKKVPFKIYHLFPSLKKPFPSRGLNPLETEALASLKKAVKANKADLGIAFDGDGDRIVFVDEKGKQVPSDLISALMAEILLRENKKASIVYTVCSSNIIKDTIRKNKGKALCSPVGYVFVKKKMKENKALFGCEYSGHFLSKEHNFCEAPLYVILNVLKEISRRKQSLSEILKPFRQAYFYSGIVNFRVNDKASAIKKLYEIYGKKGKVSRIDGLRIDFPKWWFSVRPSNTEDLLRTAVESSDKHLMLEKLSEIKILLKSMAR